MHRVPLIVLFASLCAPAAVDAEPVHGRVLVQDTFSHEGDESLAASLGARDRNDLLGNLRLTWTPKRGAWSFDLAYAASFDAGDGPALATDEAALGLFPPTPPLTAWDLTGSLSDKRRLSAEHTLDRLAIGYAGAHTVVRLGRQALTWGTGYVFHPMDLVDPFAPDATDIEYKPGTDMLYAQYLYDNGSDVQLAAIPRPRRKGGALASSASSLAVYFRRSVGSLRTGWLLARDRRDTVLALSVSGPLGGATWNAELVPTILNGGDLKVSAILNYSNAFTRWGHEWTVFTEYFRNGFGMARERYSLADLSPALIERQLRGQVFTTGRDYLAAGAQIQVTPLLEVSPTLIVNINDASLYAIAQATYSLNDNLVLVAGAQAPIGPSNTEFGGLPLAASAPPYLERPAQLYVQLRRYF